MGTGSTRDHVLGTRGHWIHDREAPIPPQRMAPAVHTALPIVHWLNILAVRDGGSRLVTAVGLFFVAGISVYFGKQCRPREVARRSTTPIICSEMAMTRKTLPGV